jgi:hypothetical protein
LRIFPPVDGRGTVPDLEFSISGVGLRYRKKFKKERGPKAPESLDNLGDGIKVRVKFSCPFTGVSEWKAFEPKGLAIPKFLARPICEFNRDKHPVLPGAWVNGDSGPCPLDGLGKGRESKERVYELICHFAISVWQGFHPLSMVLVYQAHQI